MKDIFKLIFNDSTNMNIIQGNKIYLAYLLIKTKYFYIKNLKVS